MTESADDRLDPELAPVVAAARARLASRPPLASVTPAEMRARASAEFVAWNADPPPLALVRDFAIGALTVRLYDPEPGATAPGLVYLHGGGWTIGDLELEDAAIRRIAGESGAKVLSVDYRLAPEHPFPAGLDDAVEAVRWLHASAGDMQVDPARLALGGASAGANLALAAALRLRDEGGPKVGFLVLMYGAFSGETGSSSYQEYGDGRFGLAAASMAFFWRAYAGDRALDQPLVAPLHADLSGLPAIYMNAACLDPLRDDSRDLAEALRGAGVAVDYDEYPGMIHGFTQFAKGCKVARQALTRAAFALRSGLE